MDACHRVQATSRYMSVVAAAASSNDGEEALMWRKTYTLSAQGSRNRCTVTTEDGFKIESDIPQSMGGGEFAGCRFISTKIVEVEVDTQVTRLRSRCSCFWRRWQDVRRQRRTLLVCRYQEEGSSSRNVFTSRFLNYGTHTEDFFYSQLGT